MKFRTEISLNKKTVAIRHSDRILTAGSCFADNIGKKMARLKWQIMVNPLGISYNPVSLAKQLQRAMEARSVSQDELIQNQGLWHHFDFHGQYSHPDRTHVVQLINARISTTHRFLTAADHIVLTLGTSWVYEAHESGEIVANCHKIPAAHFNRRLLTLAEMTEALTPLLITWGKQETSVVLTVSPVRHISDGLIQNSRSKSLLILLAQQLADQYDHVTYFPAYEILMDDLRDYRYYAEDMIHPSPAAVNYIWEIFRSWGVSGSDDDLIARIEKVVQNLTHRPIHQESEAHQTFLQSVLHQVLGLQKELPYTEWSAEIDRIRSQTGPQL